MPNQQQYQQQPQQTIIEQPQPVQQSQPQYVNGQVNMNGQDFNISEAGKELINMIANAQQQQQPMVMGMGQQPMAYGPMNQVYPIQQQPQNQNNNSWIKTGVMLGAAGLAGYGLARMTGGNSQDVGQLVEGVQVLSEASSSDIFDAIGLFLNPFGIIT